MRVGSAITLTVGSLFVTLTTAHLTAATAPIYRSLQSPFPSGSMGVNHLLLRTEKAKEVTWVQVSEGAVQTPRSLKGWLPRTHLLCLEDLAAEGSSNWSHGFTRSSTEVREAPQNSGKLLVLLPSETRLKIIGTTGSWAHVLLDDTKGYAHISHLITKIDFEGRPDHCFNSSMNSELRKDPQFGSAPLRRVPFLQKVKRLKTHKSHWGYAHLKDHGDVWWPMEKPGSTTLPSSFGISTAELFQRQVRNMLQSPADPELWIASADGIYRSNDGHLWEKLPHFGSNSLPIAFLSDGTLIVGTELSRNRGDTFESFVRWEKALNEIYRNQGHHPEHLKLLSVTTQSRRDFSKKVIGHTIALEVETGKEKRVKIETTDFGKSWSTQVQ